MNTRNTSSDIGEINSSKEIYKGRAFSFIAEDVGLPNGVRTEFAFVRHPGSTAIVPLFDDGTIAMTLQYRHPVKEYLLEIPAGTMEPGESPIDCARRELEEEAGFRAREFIALGQVHILPSYSDEKIHVYLARDLEPSKQNLDKDEMLNDIVRYPLEEILQMIAKGKVTCALTILSIYKANSYLRLFE